VDYVAGDVDYVLRIKVDCLIPEQYFSLAMDNIDPVIVLMLVEGGIPPGLNSEIANKIVWISILGSNDDFSIYSFDVGCIVFFLYRTFPVKGEMLSDLAMYCTHYSTLRYGFVLIFT
jgi:hypothetical protein